MPTITKADIAEHLFDEVGFNKTESKAFVDSFFNQIKTHLVNGDSVKISGFGHFMTRGKSARIGRNPKTGEEAVITARRVAFFRASQKLKNQLRMAADHQAEEESGAGDSAPSDGKPLSLPDA